MEKPNVYIPPGWTNVKIIKDPRSKHAVVGYDAKGREQRIYRQKWIDYTTNEKFKRQNTLEKRYSRFKTKINKMMEQNDLSKDCVMAYMCWIMEIMNIRVGNEIYLHENGTYGLTTLLKKSFKRTQNEYSLEFIGKRGIKHIKIIPNDKILNFLKMLIKSNKLEYLFCYKSENEFKNVTSLELNNFIKLHLGSEYSAKDIRTYSANKIFSKALGKLKYTNDRERKKNITLAIKQTAEALGNTPHVCRKNYIDPARIENY